MKKQLNFAHRGAKAYFPENTLLAFQKAIDFGAEGIELDVHLSKDGEIVVIHDETIDRTTNGLGAVIQFSVQELKSFDIEENQKIPTLTEVLDLVNRKCLVNIELKSYETSAKIVVLIENYVIKNKWEYSDFIVSSFDWNALKTVNLLNPSIQIGVLTATDLDLAISFALSINATSIHPYFHLLTQENCNFIMQKKLLNFAWTVNEIEDINKILAFGVDGIISDFPDRLAACKKNRI